MTKAKPRRKAKAKPRRKQPNPPANGKTRMVSVRLGHDMLTRIEDVAAKLETDRSGLLKAICAMYLDERHDTTVKRLIAQRELDKRQITMDLFK